ncbi:MAG: hypothetical protein CSA66_03610 [Proteobacteria bacterium]|nr:MAG: hypothetical protein CSA66_03610 [Pseudomonadota bacterium]
MNFIERILDVLDASPHKPLVTEVDGTTLLPTVGPELARLVREARAALRGRGVRPGDRVALIGANSTLWVAADLAILAEGGVTVPIYPHQAADAQRIILEDSEPRLIVCEDERTAQAGGGAPAATVHLRDLYGHGEQITDRAAPRDVDDVVSIIYTSGISGEPKGVRQTLGNLDYALPVVTDAIEAIVADVEGDHRIFHYLPFCFAGSRLMLWLSLCRGHSIYLATHVDALFDEMATARPHYLLAVPAFLERLKARLERDLAERPRGLQLLWRRGMSAWRNRAQGKLTFFDKATLPLAQRLVFDGVRRRLGPALTCLISSSAPLGADTQRWFEMIGVPVYQAYGLTETTGIVSLDKAGRIEPGRVGHPVHGCEVRVDPDTSELLVRGPNVFAGYWRKPDDTAAAFSDGGWFHTGDRVERDDSGSLRIIGRAKNLLVAASGYNIAPEPLERKLVETIAGVQHAVVVGHGRPYLTAIVSGDARREDVDRGVKRINEALPHYSRVKKFYITDEPFTPDNGMLTHNRKLRRDAIEAIYDKAIEAMYA